MVSGHGEEAGNKDETVEELKQKVKDPEDTLIDHWECHGNGGRDEIPTLKVPVKPTEQEWLEHQAIHPLLNFVANIVRWVQATEDHT